MPKKVLIVDDDTELRDSIKLPLLMRGYEIYEATQGQEALEIARREMPQIVLLDILISKLDGFRVARLLRFDERYKHIIIVAVTQLTRAETQEEARRVGFDHFITKPVNPEQLADKVDQLFLDINHKDMA